MSSACSVPSATVAVNRSLASHSLSPSGNRTALNESNHSEGVNGLTGLSYEGRLSLLGPSSGTSDPVLHHHQSRMEFDQTVVLRRIKAECDILDFQSIHKDNFMGVDMSTLPLYSAGFSPNHPANPAGIFSSVQGQNQQESAEYPSTPVKQTQAINVPHQNDSGISPGSTGAAGSAAGSTNSGDELKKRNGHSESGGEDPAAGSGVSGSPYSDHYSGDERRMLLTPTEEDDDDLLDEDDDLLDEESSSRGAGSDVVGEALTRLERALMTQPGGIGSSSNPDSSGAVYQCNMCSYSATSRFHFQAHLNSHFDVKCTHCDFTARTEGKLRAHIRNAHSDVIGMDDLEMGNSRVPRVTTQGKLKTHKCKHPQCGFVAVTKLDFWEHTRTHIKAEKLLTCPHCPFVTEYKHHLEYHTRNHLNSKPFKCPKCSYSCVNKSMLNSHMKSHSNVYQFRCQDCAYATKYQHSLKLHLRKYGHTSTANLSLNDPSVNGSESGVKPKGRRGPKKTRTKTGQGNGESSNSAHVKNTNSVQSGFHPPGSSPAALPISFNYPLYPGHPLMGQPTNPNGPTEPEKKKLRISTEEVLKCGMCEFATGNKEYFSQHLLAHAAADQHHRELASLFGVIPADLLNSPPNPQQNALHHHQSLTPLKGSPVGTPQQQQMNYFSRMLANPTLLFSTPTAPVASQVNDAKKAMDASRTPTPEAATPPPSKPNQTPLDLSREKDDLPPSSVTSVTNKHRRKGQAFKLERSSANKSPMPSPTSYSRQSPAGSGTPSPSLPVSCPPAEPTDDDEDDEDDEIHDQPIVDTSLEKPSAGKKETKVRNPQSSGGEEWGGAYQCSYCDIAFKDVVMYTMHMGYHGFQDPFTCNMCGQSTHDKLAFFLHIARSSHT